jgi:predicted AAA+ superfamily ATPase
MYQRLCNPLLSNSFFMFGARGTGKSTLVRQAIPDAWLMDLLDPDTEERFAKHPGHLLLEAKAKAKNLTWIIIDEVQKIPKLLDVVHQTLEDSETRHIKFALTGSSARKLKLAGANLLAGRAFLNELFPLTHTELDQSFDLNAALNWGTLPKIFVLDSDESKREYLRTYARVYIKEEVWDERLIHRLDPFRKFIEIAAQTSGMIVNFSNIARQTGVDDKTIKKYFEILNDTFIGFYLEAYSRSVRHQQILSPKFYLFDTGVKRAMEGLLQVPIVPKTFAYGRAFEHFVIAECIRYNSYYRSDFRFYYLKTKSDVEIDLIIDRPGKTSLVVEIKSTDSVTSEDSRTLLQFRQDFPSAKFQIWSCDPHAKQFDQVDSLHWREAIQQAFHG